MRIGTMLEAAAACLLLAAALVLSPAPAAHAQSGKPPTVAPDRCLAMSQAPGRTRFGGIAPPSLVELAQLKPGDVRFSYVGHSTFLIETPRGVRIATDYNDYVRPVGGPRDRDDEPRPLRPTTRIRPIPRSGTSCAAGTRRRRGPARHHRWRTSGSATFRPISAPIPAAPTSGAIRFSFSRSPISASGTSAISITR